MIEKIVILKPKSPLNFSESINVGINHSNNDKIFIANDDIIISKQTLEVLSKHCDENTLAGPDSNCNYGWMTNKYYTIKGVPLVPAMLPKQIEGIVEDIYEIVPSEDNVPKEVNWLAFFATMVHRKTLSEVGLLDENFVYDKEDLDYCVRAKEKGKKFLYCFDSYCFHFGGVSRKVKHAELGMKHLEDNEKNEKYFKNKHQKDKKVIGFYCSDAWEYWDENSLNKSIDPNKPSGIGGSETQVILLSRELSKLGYKVKIFNKCREQHIDSGGFNVEYIPFDKFGEYSKTIYYDYFVASRYLDCFDIPFSSGINYAMVHDVFLIMNHRHQHDVKKDRIDKYFCLSNRHKQFVHEYHNIPLDQIVVTSNGLDFSRFDKDVKKDRHQMIYSSSPDRGLELLLSLFPKVKAQVPEAKLDIFYGFENFRDQEYVKKMMNIIKSTPGVTYHGRVGQDELATAFLQSTLWAYPSWFQETFCCHPETFIQTENGWKYIKDVIVHEKVKTHLNNFKKVEKCLVKEVDTNIYKIKTKYLADTLRVTKEHPLLSLQRKDNLCVRRHSGTACTKNAKRCEAGHCYSSKHGKKYYHSQECEHLLDTYKRDWKSPDNLKKGDFLVYPINTKKELPKTLSSYFDVDKKDNLLYYKKTRSNKILDITLDKNFMELCGWYVTEGSFDHKTTLTFSLHIDEQKEKIFIEEILVSLGLSTWTCVNGKSQTLNTSSVVLARFLTESFGSGSKNKKIPQWVKDLDTPYLKYFLKGMFKGDGCKSRNTLSYECSSKDLVLDIFECLLKFKCVSSLANTSKKKPIRLESGKISHHDSLTIPAYSLTCTMSHNTELFRFMGYNVHSVEYPCQGYLLDEDYVYLPIFKIETEHYSGKVYNFEVEEDNTFVANGVVVHNCITALESMASRCVPVTSDYWGLIDTVKDGGILLPMHDNQNTVFTPEYQNKWISECVKLLKDDAYLKEWQDKGINRVQRFTWENVAKLQWSIYFESGIWDEIQ